MKIHLATWLEENQGATLTKVGAENRLMSYFFIKDFASKNFDIRKYVGEGKLNNRKKRRRGK